MKVVTLEEFNEEWPELKINKGQLFDSYKELIEDIVQKVQATEKYEFVYLHEDGVLVMKEV